jgi:CBS domain-containing protein
VARNRWEFTPVHAIMRPLNRVRTISADAAVMEALEIMGREELSYLPVVSDHTLEGVVSQQDILDALKTRSDLKAA